MAVDDRGAVVVEIGEDGEDVAEEGADVTVIEGLAIEGLAVGVAGDPGLNECGMTIEGELVDIAGDLGMIELAQDGSFAIAAALGCGAVWVGEDFQQTVTLGLAVLDSIEVYGALGLEGWADFVAIANQLTQLHRRNSEDATLELSRTSAAWRGIPDRIYLE